MVRMGETTTATLQLWATGALAPVESTAPAVAPDVPALVHAETLGSASALLRGQGPDAFSLQWFLAIENLRHQRYARWLPAVLDYTKHAGETVLGWGLGLGSDWIPFARQGANLLACSPCSHHLAYVRRNFELRSLSARFIYARSNLMPIEPASVDVVCFNGLDPSHPLTNTAIDEIYRVLRPGGKVLAMVPARFDINFWQRWLFPWQRLVGTKPSPAPVFTARQLKVSFGQFSEHRVHKRHLRRVDIPHVWRVLPQAVLERLVGQILILKAFKPLSVVLPLSAAA